MAMSAAKARGSPPVSFTLRYSPTNPPLAAMACASLSTYYKKALPKERQASALNVRVIPDQSLASGPCEGVLEARFGGEGVVIEGGGLEAARCIGGVSDRMNGSAILGGSNPLMGCEIERIVQFSTESMTSEKDAMKVCGLLDQHLADRSLMCGQGQLSLGDCVVWEAILKSAPLSTLLGTSEGKASKKFPNLKRWFSFVNSTPQFTQARKSFQAAKARSQAIKGESKTSDSKVKTNSTSQNGSNGSNGSNGGSYNIPLIGAEMGKVVTRFPPEPSGYLHIGHAKAVLLNDYFAKKWKGKCLLRFDDTNPEKEKQEFVDSILHDLKTLQVCHEPPTTTSDHFETILKYADQMIREGKAYIDDSPQEVMREERMAGVESKSRSLGVEEIKRRWNEMKKGSAYGKTCVMRAKIDMQHGNKCMRDPAMYRCKDQPHHKTGTRYKVYPTYDFACPIVDSIEGVTHTLRTVEYKDRDQQYYWFIEALGIRKPQIWSYSRLNMRYTVLSKRKLKWFAETGRVDGWNDPRFPTVQGVLRRGMTVEALRDFILLMGASVNENLMSWDKVWSMNKKVIDPKAHRFLAVSAGSHLVLRLRNFHEPKPKGAAGESKISVQLHPKFRAIGMKEVPIAKEVLVEAEDLSRIANGEEITLMRWGNAVIESKSVENGVPVCDGYLKLDGNPKNTKNRITWIANDLKAAVPITAVEFDVLITKPKLDEGDKFEDYLTPKTKFETKLLGEAALRFVKEGQIIQLERRGYYRCDKTASDPSGMVLFNIPSGKAKSMSSLSTKVKVKN
ncbi:hypothetical protein AAMO2058_001354700 [Amorphochlora amoebiformis]